MSVPQVKKTDYMTPHQRKRSLRSLELYLQGYSWTNIAKLGGYTWGVFSKLMLVFPDLSKAYSEARRQSGQAFEDKALVLAEQLVGKNEFSGTQVRAHEVAMNQYRWSASRRDPTGYAEAGAKQVSVVVPVQINSSLNLAQPGAVTEVAEPSVWEVHAEVLGRPPEAEDVLEVESDPEVEETTERPAVAGSDPILEAIEEAGLEVAFDIPAGEDLAKHLGLPDELPTAIKKRPSPGRPRKGHKNKRQTSTSRTHMLQKARRNPTVARALGLEPEPTNEPTVDAGDQSAEHGRGKPVHEPRGPAG